MNKKTILVLRGLQGSGKTTFAKQWVNESPGTRIRLNRDDFRNMFGPYWVPSRENFITKVFWAAIDTAVNDGYEVVIDNMNLDQRYVDEIEEYVKDLNDWLRLSPVDYQYTVEVKDFFNVPIQTCIDQDAQRANPIGEKTIRSTYNKYKNRIAPWKYLS